MKIHLEMCDANPLVIHYHDQVDVRWDVREHTALQTRAFIETIYQTDLDPDFNWQPLIVLYSVLGGSLDQVPTLELLQYWRTLVNFRTH